MNYFKNAISLGLIISILLTAFSVFGNSHYAPKLENSVVSSVENLDTVVTYESIQGSIIRNRDSRNITAANAVYPNDRVARGEGYTLRINYSTDTIPDVVSQQQPGPNFFKVKVVQIVDGRVTETRYYHNYTKYNAVFSWSGTVSMNPAFREVYYKIYNDQGKVQSIRLPIGSY